MLEDFNRAMLGDKLLNAVNEFYDGISLIESDSENLTLSKPLGDYVTFRMESPNYDFYDPLNEIPQYVKDNVQKLFLKIFTV